MKTKAKRKGKKMKNNHTKIPTFDIFEDIPKKEVLGLPVPRKLLSLEECAEFLNLSIRTMYKMCYSGTIPNHRIGKQWRFDPFEVIRAFRNDKLG